MDAPISHKPSKFRGFPFFNLPCKNTPSTTSTFLLTSLPNIWGMRGIAHETCSWLRTNLATWTVAGRWNWSGWQDCAEQKLPWHSTEVHKLGFCFLVEPLSPIKPYKGYIRGSMQNVSFVDWGVIQKVQKQWVKNHRMAHLLRSVLTISCLPQSATPLWPSRPKLSGALFANWRSRPEVNSSAMTRAAVPTEGSGALARLARCAQHCSTSHKQPREGVIQSMCCLCRDQLPIFCAKSLLSSPSSSPLSSSIDPQIQYVVFLWFFKTPRYNLALECLKSWGPLSSHSSLEEWWNSSKPSKWSRSWCLIALDVSALGGLCRRSCQKADLWARILDGLFKHFLLFMGPKRYPIVLVS